MELTPQQRDRIQRLLEEELRATYRAQLAHGARPADVAEMAVDRRQALNRLLLDLAHDPEHPLDDVIDRRGIGEQDG